MRGENTPTRWRAGGAQVAEIMPEKHEYEVTVKFARDLGDDCAVLIARGEVCDAEALARQIADELQRACDGGMAGRFQVTDVRLREKEGCAHG